MKKYHSYVKKARKNGHSYSDIAKHLKQHGYSLLLIAKIFLTLDFKKKIETAVFFSLLAVFVFGGLYLNLNSPTGFVAKENVSQQELVINQRVYQNSTIKIKIHGRLTELKASGEIIGNGTAAVYLVAGNDEYLIYSNLQKQGLASITGNIIADNLNVSLKIPVINETGEVVEDAEIVEENDSIENVPEKQIINETVHNPVLEEVIINLTQTENTSTLNISNTTVEQNATIQNNSIDAIDEQNTTVKTNETIEQNDSIILNETSALNETYLHNETTKVNDTIKVNESSVNQTENETQETQPETRTLFDEECSETCVLELNETNYTLKIVLDDAALYLEKISYTNIIIVDADESNLSSNISTNITANLTYNLTNITQNYTGNITPVFDRDVINMSEIIINRPVLWKVNVNATKDKEFVLPKETINISSIAQLNIVVDDQNYTLEEFNTRKELDYLYKQFRKTIKSQDNLKITNLALEIESLERETEALSTQNNISVVVDSNDTIELEYYTEGPSADETVLSRSKKLVTISSDLHYQNVTAYTTLETEAMPSRIQLRWLNNNSVVPVAYIDNNRNGLTDEIRWIVPHLSNQTYEVTINILTVQSYPTVGGFWTVGFETSGTADLNITGWEGTTYGNDIAHEYIRCGETDVPVTQAGNSVIAYNYSCNTTGYHVVEVLSKGSHTRKFDFGGMTAFAHNYASSLPKTLNIQGKLANSTGGLINASTNFSFKIYDAFTGGNMLWEENHSLFVNEGIYDAILGYKEPITLDFNISYYLGISVNEDNEMSPRMNLTSSPYAFSAITSDNAYNITCEDCITGSQINESTLTGINANTLDNLDSTDFCQSDGSNCPGGATADTPWANNSNEIYPAPGYPADVNVTGNLRVEGDVIINLQE